jgi:hypothetical protein
MSDKSLNSLLLQTQESENAGLVAILASFF